MYPKDLVKLLEKNGWAKVSQSGSHLKMRKRKPDRNNSIHNRDIPKGLVATILKRTGTQKVVPSPLILNILITKENNYIRKGSVMNIYFYPAIFTYDENDKCYMVEFIDLKGCSTYGKTINEAYLMLRMLWAYIYQI